MKKIDKIMKEYVRIPEIFCELVNGSLFNGKIIARCEDAQELDTTLISSKKNREKIRDIVKSVCIEGTEWIIGIENQLENNYVMPIRSLIYDGLSYEELIKKEKIRLQDEEISINPIKEVLCGTRFSPVVSIIFYYGKRDGMQQAVFMNCWIVMFLKCVINTIL